MATTLSYSIRATDAADAVAKARAVASTFFGGLTGVNVTTADTITPAETDASGNIAAWTVPVTATK